MRNLIVVTGPSCAGKSTFVNNLVGITRVISTTTRPPREGETNGVDYHFVTKDEFEKLNFIERSEVYGNQYGITYEALERTKGNVVIIMDVYGALKFKDAYSGSATYVFVTAPFEELIRRMKKRNDANNPIRIHEAWEEMKLEQEFDYTVHNAVLESEKWSALLQRRTDVFNPGNG